MFGRDKNNINKIEAQIEEQKESRQERKERERAEKEEAEREKEAKKKYEKDAEVLQQQRIYDLDANVPFYKPHWNKDGVIQFKNERIAILQRTWGLQVQFIVAFDDLTRDGYELKAIDEGKTGGDLYTGGQNSYYYFQKRV